MALCLHDNEADQCNEPCARCGHSCWKHCDHGCDHGVLNCSFDTGDVSCKCGGFVSAPPIKIK